MNPSSKISRMSHRSLRATLPKFRPFGAVRCSDETPTFRSQLARDLGCLLDVDDTCVAWCCRPVGLDQALLQIGWKGGSPDFFVTYDSGLEIFLHAVDEACTPEVTEAAACLGLHHRFVPASDIRPGFRLQNAKDLLAYAHVRAPLGDRVRVLAALDQEGSISVAECLQLFREVNPMAGLASLVLHRFVSIDLDAELIAPHTEVRPFRK